MQAIDFFGSRIDVMFNMNDTLAVLATRLPWRQLEEAVATKFGHQNRTGEILKAQDMFGTTETVIGAGRCNAGRPKLPIRLMASRLYLKHRFNVSDEELVVRWSENIVWQYFSGMDYYEHRLPLQTIACAAGYNLRWLLRAIARLGIGELFLRMLHAALSKHHPTASSYGTLGRSWMVGVKNLGDAAMVKNRFLGHAVLGAL